jgi:hypothetical protein
MKMFMHRGCLFFASLLFTSTVIGSEPLDVWPQFAPSAASSLDFGVQPFEFSASVVDLELPIDATLLGVGFL